MRFDPPDDPVAGAATNRVSRRATRLLDNLVRKIAERAQLALRAGIRPDAPGEGHRNRPATSIVRSEWYFAEFVAAEHSRALPVLFGHRRIPALLTVLRSNLECALRLARLTHSVVTVESREARALTSAAWQAKQREDLSNRAGLPMGDVVEAAEATGLTVDRNKKGEVIGIAGERWPKAADLLDFARRELSLSGRPDSPEIGDTYGLLSSTPHGSAWLATVLLTRATPPSEFWFDSRTLLGFATDGVWFYGHAVEQLCRTTGSAGPINQPWFQALIGQIGELVEGGPGSPGAVSHR